MASVRRARLACLVALALAAVPGCASAPEGSWTIAPIEYDNSLDDDGRVSRIDVTYSMPNVASDGVGGFWTESAGSWLHLDEAGDTLRRFDLEGEMQYLRVRGIAAVDADTLVVSGFQYADGQGGLYLFDTVAMTWAPIPTTPADSSGADLRMIGAVTVVDDDVLYVETRSSSASGMTFVVRRIDATGEDTIVSPELPIGTGQLVRLGAAGEVIVASTDDLLARISTITGEAELTPLAAGVPTVSASTAGRTAWATEPKEPAGQWDIQGGSGEARDLIEQTENCDLRAVEIDGYGRTPPLCNIQAIAWVDANTLVVTAGTESGTVMGRVELPGR